MVESWKMQTLQYRSLTETAIGTPTGVKCLIVLAVLISILNVIILALQVNILSYMTN